MTKAELDDEIDKRIESIKSISTTLIDILADIDEQRRIDNEKAERLRQKDINDLNRRVATLEHEFARITSK